MSLILTLPKHWVELAKLDTLSEPHGDQLCAAYKLKISGIFDEGFFDQLEFGDKALDLALSLYHKDGQKKRAITSMSLKGKGEQHEVALTQDKVSHEFHDATISNFTVRAFEEGKIKASFWLEFEPSKKHAEKQVLFLHHLLEQREFQLEILPPPASADARQTSFDDDSD